MDDNLSFYVAIGSLLLAVVFMTLMMLSNLKMLRETKQIRLEMRRAEKRRKNELLRKAFNLNDSKK
jgi:hypothetical protein